MTLVEIYKDSQKTKEKYSKKNWPPVKRISLSKEKVEAVSMKSNLQSRTLSNDHKAGLTGYHFAAVQLMHMDKKSSQALLHHKYRSTTINRS